ncbi:hypothetical protein AKJ38_03780 [candidate division MSBL1 archaeon SCGC-AAA259I14]|uniref:Transcription regulator AsnC/Lrp ligand binding domain-containing protein n=1 Tax=candidate division MSBL1 archaeon SCGC-AAA259I14 TaxID=1698268 RepID=A0A133UPP2_9EURY|nr:hypothetical protein AKJ38_03780 [candidate division MSBL1 archaeon SCGC-AAA259I14]
MSKFKFHLQLIGNGVEKMVEAIVLITTAVGMEEEVFDEVRKKPEVQKAVLITGQHDIMAIARADDIEEISKVLMTEVRNIDGVKSTSTSIVLR